MTATVPGRPVLRYHGGKWLLAPWIIAHFPKHRLYTEAFGGAASVLMQKPRAHGEVYNDLDDEIVNVFRVLRHDVTARLLGEALRMTPFARAEFLASYDEMVCLCPTDDIERARRTIVRSFMGFGSAATNREHTTGFRANSNRSGTVPARDWVTYVDAIPAFVERLHGVTVENRDAVEVIVGHDGDDTLHYVDPPYVHDTRNSSSKAYRYELDDDAHRSLLNALRSLRGMVVVSGYQHQIYEDGLAGWRRVERAHHADNRSARTEVLWLNAAAARRQSAQEALFA